jgi:hypothetical protein
MSVFGILNVFARWWVCPEFLCATADPDFENFRGTSIREGAATHEIRWRWGPRSGDRGPSLYSLIPLFTIKARRRKGLVPMLRGRLTQEGL